MNKVFLSLILIALSVDLINAMDGDGSSSNPFRGTLSVSDTWSLGEFTGNTVYIGISATPDLTVTTGGHLTIEPGVTVILTQLTSDLLITGSGILTAEGTSTNKIVFTRASGKSHWGHISFETPGSGTPITGTGSFKYCQVEYGYAVTSGFNPDNGGGGIQVNASNVVIEHCYFNNNESSFGGAMVINSNMNTQVRNCEFYLNNANAAGGAVLVRNGTTAVIENNIFNQNSCDGSDAAVYSGGAIWLYSNTSKILNNTFYLNTTKASYTGDAIYSYSSTGSKIINSLFWGSDDQVAYNSTFSPTITYCAFQTAKPSTATNSLVLSGTVADHFTNAGGGNLSLIFISPCRDAGTNTYTGLTIPSTDYMGNPRISTKDIGTYEVQYSRWAGTTSNQWATASNWESSIDPSTGTGDVVIPTGLSTYPTGSTTQDFTIGSGKQMIIEQGGRVTLDDLTNNGIIKLNHDASGFASLIINSYTRGTGATEEIQLYLVGGGSALLEDYKWHYISTPVSTLSTNVFTGVTFDLAQYIESRVSTSLLQGWVAYDGYVYSTGLSNGPTFSSLTPGKGYDFWDNANNTFTFGGLFNTSDAAMSLSYTSIPSKHGFNLLGNPFSSGLDWDQIASGTYFTYPSNTSKGVYFTQNNLQCTYINGVGTPSGVTGIIPPMQGFFVKTYSTGNTITLAKAARTNSNIHSRYKGDPVIPLVRLALENDTASFDETVVRFDEAAKSDLDNDFDALKMFITSTKNQIYTFSGGTNFAINGLPFPTAQVIIPVVTNITTQGNYKVSATQLQGLDAYNVSLLDNTTGFTADLKITPNVLFTANAGTFTDRFSLIFSISTGIENPKSSVSKFNIYTQNGLINIIPVNDEWSGKTGSVNILNLTGKNTGSLSNVEFQNNTPVQIQAPQTKGMYVIEIRSGISRYVQKVVVK